jgi:hypothetical protein
MPSLKVCRLDRITQPYQRATTLTPAIRQPALAFRPSLPYKRTLTSAAGPRASAVGHASPPMIETPVT